ncbi:MAG: SdrD B-like domain-containing protein, partial [Actinomycetota bacterium]
NGEYLFDGLVPGTYVVVFTPPDGMAPSPQDVGENDEIDSDADGDGLTTEVDLVSGSAIRDRDAGFYEPASIGNLVWIDADADGFQDEDEAGIADVTVRLLDDTGDVVATTITDHAGRYLFENLPPGMYQIEVVTPSGMEVTDPDLDPGDLADSDLDAATARTPLTELVAGEVDQSWDAGLVIPTVVLSTPDEIGETPELAFTGATVVGLAAAGMLLIGLGGTARILSDRMRRQPGVV